MVWRGRCQDNRHDWCGACRPLQRDAVHRRLSISGQTFYTFVLGTLEKFGALKAIAAKGREPIYMILFMVTCTALTGYGLDIGLVTLMILNARHWPPGYIATIIYGNLGLAVGMVVPLAGMSGYAGGPQGLQDRTVRHLRGVASRSDLMRRRRTSRREGALADSD